jgi:rabenosyn-5
LRAIRLDQWLFRNCFISFVFLIRRPSVFVVRKRISVLGLDNPEPPTPKALRLQQMIAARASAFIQENLLGLPTLPTEAELARLHEAKRAEAQRRIAEERRLEREQQRRREEAESQSQRDADARAKASSSSKTGVRFSSAADGGVAVITDAGWKPDEVTTATGRRGVGQDPMIQQMDIIRGYIKQARDARRWDEVQMLEDNLKELQREYWAQRGTAQ